jgi:hypothetical protein
MDVPEHERFFKGDSSRISLLAEPQMLDEEHLPLVHPLALNFLQFLVACPGLLSSQDSCVQRASQHEAQGQTHQTSQEDGPGPEWKRPADPLRERQGKEVQS